MDCSQCCEVDVEMTEESVGPKVKQGVHPFGDQDMDQGNEDATELEEGAMRPPLPPPPDVPEDLDASYRQLVGWCVHQRFARPLACNGA